MAINTRLIGNLGSGGQLHQALNARNVTIGQAGKHYLVQITSTTKDGAQYAVKDNQNRDLCVSGGSSTVLLPGGSGLTSGRDFIAVWQEIDGYTNH